MPEGPYCFSDAAHTAPSMTKTTPGTHYWKSIGPLDGTYTLNVLAEHPCLGSRH